MGLRIENYWYSKGPVSFLLFPLSWVYCAVAAYRRGKLERNRAALQGANGVVNVIVVGNISVGGTGKTPMVVWLEEFLRARGYAPGIVSRGYGGRNIQLPQRVLHGSDARDVGDEAVLIARRSVSPVWVCADRLAAIHALLRENPVTNVIISDDGLQHYRMPRDIEIVMIDGARRFGNRLCLPAGPLREPVARAYEADFRVVSGLAEEAGEFGMEVSGELLVNLLSQTRQWSLVDLAGETVHAVAGLGNPSRFFNKLELLGLNVIRHAFPDHHEFHATDIRFADDLPVIMTEKDAVKCTLFADSRHWYLPVKARPDGEFANALLRRLKEIQRGQKAA